MSIILVAALAVLAYVTWPQLSSWWRRRKHRVFVVDWEVQGRDPAHLIPVRDGDHCTDLDCACAPWTVQALTADLRTTSLVVHHRLRQHRQGMYQ